jgi:hypothetical protein
MSGRSYRQLSSQSGAIPSYRMVVVSAWPASRIPSGPKAEGREVKDGERGVRPEKTQQKISGRLTSEDATQDRLDIRSYIDTARKHGQDVLTVLHRLMLGDPWTPPAPAGS